MGTWVPRLGPWVRWDEAIRWHREALRLRADADTHCNLGVALVEEAIKAFKEALEIDPANTWLRSSLVTALLMVEEVEQALRISQEGVRSTPAAADLHCSLGGGLSQYG